MLSFEDLKNLKNIPGENEVSLQLYAQFYNSEIANRTYEIHLKNNQVINLKIAPTNFPHLIGLHKFYDKSSHNTLLRNIQELKEFKGYYNLYKGNIKIDDLKLVVDNKGNNVYEKNKDRILGFPFIHKLLRESLFLKFGKGKVEGRTTIPNGYLFINQIKEDRALLFITNNNNSYYPVTFIAVNKESPTYELYSKNQDIFEVKKVDIKDFKTNQLIESIIPGKKSNEIGKALNEVAATKDIKDIFIEKEFTKGQLSYLEKNHIKFEGKRPGKIFNRVSTTYNSNQEQKIKSLLQRYKNNLEK